MKTAVAENRDIDRDMHTYAYAYFDSVSLGSSAFHARVIDAIFLTFVCTEVVYSHTQNHLSIENLQSYPQLRVCERCCLLEK